MSEGRGGRGGKMQDWHGSASWVSLAPRTGEHTLARRGAPSPSPPAASRTPRPAAGRALSAGLLVLATIRRSEGERASATEEQETCSRLDWSTEQFCCRRAVLS